MNRSKMVKEIPELPDIYLLGEPTVLEKLAYEGPFDENSNLIRGIVDDLSEPLSLRALRVKGDLFSIKGCEEQTDETESRKLCQLYMHGGEDFNYTFGNIIRETVRALVFHGRAWLEIRLGLDEGNNVCSVRFLLLHAQLKEVGMEETEFTSITWEGKPVDFKVDAHFLVPLSLEGAGLPKDLFTAAFKKIRGLPQISDEMENVQHPKPGYNFNEKVRNREMTIIQATKDIFYEGYPVDRSKLMSDFHLIWRTCHFRIMKRKMIDYIVQQVNKTLAGLEKEYDFPGKIVINVPVVDYMGYYQRLKAGEITLKGIHNIFLYGEH